MISLFVDKNLQQRLNNFIWMLQNTDTGLSDFSHTMQNCTLKECTFFHLIQYTYMYVNQSTYTCTTCTWWADNYHNTHLSSQTSKIIVMQTLYYMYIAHGIVYHVWGSHACLLPAVLITEAFHCCIWLLQIHTVYMYAHVHVHVQSLQLITCSKARLLMARGRSSNS